MNRGPDFLPGVRLWGYLPSAATGGAPLLLPTSTPPSQPLRSVGGGGCGFALAITESGQICMWGSTTDFGQSRHSKADPQEEMRPHLLRENANFVQVDGGWAHVVALTDEGRVYTWGWSRCAPRASLTERGSDASAANVCNPTNDEEGRRARAAEVSDEMIAQPSLVSLAPGVAIKSVATGGRHTLALSSAGKIWGWGCGGEGQLGLGCRVDLVSTPQLIDHFEAPNSAQNESALAKSEKWPTQVLGSYVAKISCGGRHSAVLTDTGAVLTFGWGLYGQCGYGGTEDQLNPRYVSALSGIKVVDVAAGLWHTMLVTDSGDVYCSGGNQFGQLGTGGDRAEMLPTLIDELENEIVVSASCGARHSAVLTEKGKVFCWGWNKYGQLGLADTDNRDVPVEVALGNVVATSLVCGWWHTLGLVVEPSTLEENLRGGSYSKDTHCDDPH